MAFDLDVRESYAKALLAAAEKSGREKAIFDAARDLADYLDKHTDRRLRTFIESPQIPTNEKHKLIRDMFKGRVDPLLVDLMCLMIDKRRSQYVAPALWRFCELVDEKENIYPGQVATARALDDEEKKRAQAVLEEYTGARLRLKFRVEDDLIGGVWFKYRDLLIDNTLRAALDELRERFDAKRLRLATPEIEGLT